MTDFASYWDEAIFGLNYHQRCSGLPTLCRIVSCERPLSAVRACSPNPRAAHAGLDVTSQGTLPPDADAGYADRYSRPWSATGAPRKHSPVKICQRVTTVIMELSMRIVTLEEHFTIPSLVRRISPDAIARRGFPVGNWRRGAAVEQRMPEIGALRLGEMGQAAIATQVLSVSGPGADLVDGLEGVTLARDFNDALATAISEHPDRFAGFAHLPMRSPDAAADEFERTVRDLGFCGALINGMTEDLFLDDSRFDPILSRAEQLGVPIYVHPGIPPESVRKAYYDNLPHSASFRLAIAGWGWHSETAIHILRLVLSGVLDRHPRLKLIIGHMGEGLAAMLARCDQIFANEVPHLKRSVAQTILDQVWVTTSGMFTLPPFFAALAVFGIDRIMFSIDYPFSSNQQGRDFLDSLPLAPVDLAKVAHVNADQLLKLTPQP